MSAFYASATSPRTSSLAGFMLVNVPASPSTSLPSIIIFGSKATGVSAMVLASVLLRGRKSHREGRYALQYRLRKHPSSEHHRPPSYGQTHRAAAHGPVSGDAQNDPRYVVHPDGWKNPVGHQEHRRVRSHTAAAKRPVIGQRLDQSI